MYVRLSIGASFKTILLKNVFSTAVDSRKKILIPIFKKIHPDLFAQEGKDIQQANLHCMHNLTEIVDAIDSFEALLKSQIQELTIAKPLQSDYSLKCYVLRPLHENPSLTAESLTTHEDTPMKPLSENYIVELSFKLQTPIDLTTKRIIESSKLSKSLRLVKQNLGEYFSLLKVDNPWPEVNFNSDEERTSTNSKDAVERGQFPSNQQHAINVFEQAMKSSFRLSAFSSFSPNEKYKSQLRDWVADAADAYVHRGQVFVKGLSPVDEVKAVKKVRDFLADYGDMLNFTSPHWTRIILIIYGARVDPGSSRFGSKELKKEDWAYRVQTKNNRYLVEIPYKFRAKDLLAFLSKEVPGTNVF